MKIILLGGLTHSAFTPYTKCVVVDESKDGFGETF